MPLPLFTDVCNRRIQGDIGFIKLLDLFEALVEDDECSNFLVLTVSEDPSMFKATSYLRMIGAEHYHKVRFGVVRLPQKLLSI